MILKSDFNTLVFNSTGRAKATPDLSGYFCGMNLSAWRQTTKALLSFCVKISNCPNTAEMLRFDNELVCDRAPDKG